MLCCVQNAHHASSLCDIQSPQPQLSIFSCASIAFSPVSWNCLPQALLSVVAEQTTLELGGSFQVGVIKNGEGANCHLSWLYVCSLHVPAALKSFSTAFPFPFLENISSWKLTWNLERMNTVAFQQWDALCPQEKGDRTEGLILSDEASVLFPWAQKDHAACGHLGSYDEFALQAWGQPVKSTSWMMALL